MTQTVKATELSEKQKQEIDEMALERVRAMNSDEYLCQRIDDKVHAMEAHLQSWFQHCFTRHQSKNSGQ